MCRPLLKLYFLLLLCVSVLCGCSTIAYYSQSISGQLDILSKRQTIDTVLADERTPELTRQKLITFEKIRDFAEQQLLLPNRGSYRHYANLDRPFVVWNVFATPELSLKPLRWCFLVVGCLSYRGYFKKQKAVEFSTELKNKGMDVYIGGVTAFSTLGWFNDPVMNTMLNRDAHDLARLVFHELAHQKLYVKNDTEFNEAFADAVAIIGTKRWLVSQQTPQQPVEMEFEREKQFTQLVLRFREKLQSLYSSDIPDNEKRRKKAGTIHELRNAYRQLRAGWGNDDSYDAWINSTINNAKLSAIATYRNLVPDFLAVYAATGNDLKLFYTVIEKLEYCEKPVRYELLQAHSTSVNC